MATQSGCCCCFGNSTPVGPNAVTDDAEPEDANGSSKTANPLLPPAAHAPKIDFVTTLRGTPATIEAAVAELEAIRKRYDFTFSPQPVERDVTRVETTQTAKALRLKQEQLPHDIAWLKANDGATIPGADKFTAQQFDNPKANLLSRLEKFLPAELKSTRETGKKYFEDILATSNLQFVQMAAEVDMTDQTAVTNLLGSELKNQSRQK